MSEPAALVFDEVQVGQRTHFFVDLTERMVADFAAVSGDTNPLHTDSAYAAQTPFGGTIVHGMLGASFFSQLIGMHLPGRYALYLSQKMTFRKPARVGMRIRVEGEVTQKTLATKTIVVATRIFDEAEECLIDGEALVSLLA